MRRPHLNRGPWNAREDSLIIKYIKSHDESLPKNAGILRCGKSCRIRWTNYLRPDITAEEEDLIIRLHSLLGNRWSLIAGRIPGRTVNEIKNYWNSHLSKRTNTLGTHQKTSYKDQQSDSACEQGTKVDLPESAEDKNSFDSNVDGYQMQDFGLCWLESELEDDVGHSGGQSMVGDKDHKFDNHENHKCLVSANEALLEKIYKEYQKLL